MSRLVAISASPGASLEGVGDGFGLLRIETGLFQFADELVGVEGDRRHATQNRSEVFGASRETSTEPVEQQHDRPAG